MKKSMIRKTTVKEIKDSLGRYLAILAIVALGVGFFAGLRSTKPAMIQMAQDFFDTHEFYDYRIVSTLGFEQEDVETLAAVDGVEAAEGAVTQDFLSLNENGVEKAFVALSVSKDVNQPELVEGRMPEAADECMIDSRYTDLSIGDVVVISENNDENTTEMFSQKEYRIVGKAMSPLYVNFERGTTSLLDGKVSAFVYFPEEAFDVDYYTDIYIAYNSGCGIYSKEYDSFLDEQEDKVEAAADMCLERRYDSIVNDAQEEIDDAAAEIADHEQEISDGKAELSDAKEQLSDAKEALDQAERQITSAEKQISDGRKELADAKEQLDTAVLAGAVSTDQAAYQQMQLEAEETALAAAEQELAANRTSYQDSYAEYESNEAELVDKEQELSDAEVELADVKDELADAEAEFSDQLEEMEDRAVYVLGRDTNIGYVSFENDASIVEAIAYVFPVFFFLVAALVCMTTMTRMVEEQRTQIGVLKALGYGNRQIMNKYLFYSTSAALIGSLIGFFAGCYLFPKVIWQAYGIMYEFPGEIPYLADPILAAALLAVAFLCTGGATYLSCCYELGSVPAALIRPKTPKAGKRIFLERIPAFWNRLKFMQKVSLRNTFRYKKRFFMMMLGISGCTALLVTGFGINDSISDIVGLQYEQIEKYDASVNLKESLTEEGRERLKTDTEDYLRGICYVDSSDIDVINENLTRSVTMIVAEDGDGISDFVELHKQNGDPVSYPGKNEALISDKAADKLGVTVGDTVTLQDTDFNRQEVTVTGIFENYIYNYIYISPETYEEFKGNAPEYRTAYVLYNEKTDAAVSSKLLEEEQVISVSENNLMVERFGNMIESLNAIVVLIILCAAALAFIVLYNLTNINITEREREIATIKVLGFYRNEVSSYVLRENVLLTAFGAFAGLFLGKALLAFVISQIDINIVRFPMIVQPISYLYSMVLTFVFAMLVNLFMGRRLKAIDMAESLKEIE